MVYYISGAALEGGVISLIRFESRVQRFGSDVGYWHKADIESVSFLRTGNCITKPLLGTDYRCR
jgi:hypothetical protein